MSLGSNGRPWWHVSKRLPRNPFDPQPVIEHLEWCRNCKMDVSVQVETGHADGVDVYRKLCQRCGRVMQWGMGQRHLANRGAKPLPARALRFIRETGRDRT